MNNSSRVVVGPSRSSSLVGACLAFALVAGGGACTLSVEADVPDVQVTQHDVMFPGVPMAGLAGDVSTGISFTQNLPALDLPSGIDSTVQAVKVDLIAKSGVSSFDFLSALHITMTPNAAGATPIELISYEKPAGTTVGTTLSIPAKNPINILDQWKADSASFDVQVAGTLPEKDWAIDVSVHFAGQVSYKY